MKCRIIGLLLLAIYLGAGVAVPQTAMGMTNTVSVNSNIKTDHLSKSQINALAKKVAKNFNCKSPKFNPVYSTELTFNYECILNRPLLFIYIMNDHRTIQEQKDNNYEACRGSSNIVIFGDNKTWRAAISDTSASKAKTYVRQGKKALPGISAWVKKSNGDCVYLK
jgi:hypothetical protein